jgi:hypothetical protein
MSFKNKILEKYYFKEEARRLTPLRKYIRYIGLDWTKMNEKQIDKIARTQAYKQFKGLRKIKKTIDKNIQNSSVQESKDVQPRQYDLHNFHKMNPAHMSKKKRIVDLINKGYSMSYKLPKSKSGSPRHRGFKAPNPLTKKFHKDIPGHGTRHVSMRLPKGYEIHGKMALKRFEDVENQSTKLLEKEMNQVDKLLNKSKQMKERDQANAQEFEIQKTMTGNSANTNVIEINPTISSTTRLQT